MGRLDHSDARKLVTSVAAGRTLARGLAEEILELSEGVPLFVEELTKSVLEARPGSGSEASEREAQQIAMVPASLQSWLAARLDRLGTAREVARIGAVIGREFEYDLLFAVSGLSEGGLASALERLCDSGLLFRRGNQREATFLFKHALIQDAAYGSLLRADRRDWHRKIAKALEADFPETVETQPELLAYHFTEAGVAERAVGYWSKAGQQALRLSAMAEAAALLGKGLTLISAVPDSRQRDEHELDLQIAYGQAIIATHGYSAPAVGQAYARARELCQELRYTNKLLPILYGQWGHHSVTDLRQARALAADIQHFCEPQDDSVARVTSCRANGLTHLVAGEFEAAIVLLEDGLALYDSAEQNAHASIYAPTDPLVFFRSYLSLAHTCCGNLDRALSLSDSALAYARNLSHAHSLAFALHWIWAARRCARFEPSILLSQADELMVLSEERSFAMWRALGLAFRGWCVSTLGQPDRGIPLMTAGLAEIRDSGRLHVPHVLTLAGDAYRMAGDSRAALACVVEAEQFAETMETRWLQAETLRLHGDLLRGVGDCTGAEGRFLEAIALARRQSARLFQLRSSTSLASLWRDQGRRAEASELLVPICRWFSDGFDLPDLFDATALVSALG